MPWLILLLAGFFEIAWAIGLKYPEGFTRVAPTSIALALLGVSVYPGAARGGPPQRAPPGDFP